MRGLRFAERRPGQAVQREVEPRLAVRLAEDRAFAGTVREAIRVGLRSTPLVDMPAHTRNLESAYLEALRRKAPDVLIP